MLPNGHYLIIDRAVRAVDHPLTTRYRRALILGAFREDVGYVPGLGAVFEKLSLTHFSGAGLPGGFVPLLIPGAGACAERHFARAVREHRAGRPAAAFVQLGKAGHLLVDMACPTHAQRIAHASDPYEWAVEASKDALGALPIPALDDVPPADLAGPRAIVEALARRARTHRADRTSNAWGWLMWRLGRRAIVTAAEAGAQARDLVPAAIAHMAALLRLFLKEVHA